MKQENIPLQRAGLMGLITAILHDEGEKTIQEIKQKIVASIAHMVQEDVMVGDVLDMFMVDAAKEFCEQEEAVNNVKDILNGE